jgi:ribosomal protein S18 acetylase RimI-like enzyme
MIRLIQPLDNRPDFERLTETLLRLVNHDESFRFLSYSMVHFDKEAVESLTEKHKENGIDYIVFEENGRFQGVLAIKRNESLGFELFMLAVEQERQKSGVGQSLVSECISIAQKENYRAVDTVVFADNKNMLRLLLKNDFIPVGIEHHARADGMDLIKLRRYSN